jgi:hypothetical protein
MTTKDNGGTAFPGPTFTMAGYPNGHSMGMTLRDWFAGQALVAFFGSQPFLEECGNKGKRPSAYAAKIAFDVADAMIEARK